jgi:hypothetical protein
MGYQFHSLGSIPDRGKETFLYSAEHIPTLELTQSHVQRIPEALSEGLKGSEHEAYHSPPSSIEIKSDRAKPPLLHTSSWHGAELIKHRDNFTFKI